MKWQVVDSPRKMLVDVVLKRISDGFVAEYFLQLEWSGRQESSWRYHRMESPWGYHLEGSPWRCRERTVVEFEQVLYSRAISQLPSSKHKHQTTTISENHNQASSTRAQLVHLVP